MAADSDGNNISLKALVNNVINKVIFIESDDDFVDVLFSFLTFPIGTIIRLSHRRSQPLGIGCIKNLYQSVESFDLHLFRTEECREMLLCSRNEAESLSASLKLNIGGCDPPRYYCCSCGLKTSFSYYNIFNCPICEGIMDRAYAAVSRGGFVKEPATFIICDDLQVMPPITSASTSLVNKLGFMGWDTVDELTFSLGVDEVLNLLLCSLVSKTPLTETLLKHKPRPKSSNENLNEAIDHESQMVGETIMNEEQEDITIKLIVSKSKKMVCYAEAGEDFVDLLFSFLILPLGFIVKQMKDNSFKGCIDQLYKSVQDLNEAQYSNFYKEMLVSPKLLPGFCYENHPFGIKEASFYYVFGSYLTADPHLCPTESLESVKFIDPKSGYEEDDSAHGFLRVPAMFVVTDSLKVSPISAILGLSILRELQVPTTDIEEQVVHVSKEKALHLLVASFVRDSALTSVFLRKPKQEQ